MKGDHRDLRGIEERRSLLVNPIEDFPQPTQEGLHVKIQVAGPEGLQVLDAVGIVLRGALRGAKDVRAAALIGIGVIWTCVPPAAFLLGKVAGWGALGGWMGFLAETTLSATLYWKRYRRGAWRLDYTCMPSARLT